MRHSDHYIGPVSRWAVDMWTVAKTPTAHISTAPATTSQVIVTHHYVKGGGIRATFSFDRTLLFVDLYADISQLCFENDLWVICAAAAASPQRM